MPGSFIGKWGAYFGGIDTVNWYAVGITIVTVLIAVYMPKITSKVPGFVCCHIGGDAYRGIPLAGRCGDDDRFRVRGD